MKGTIMTRAAILALAIFASFLGTAHAQNIKIVPACNAQSLSASPPLGQVQYQDEAGNLCVNAGLGIYPAGSAAITASATGTTGATTATLAANATLHTYICGLSIRANASAAATGNATVTGVVTATMNFTQWTAPNATGLGITEMIFAPCITSSAINTAIAVVSAAPGTGGVVSVSAWGFQGPN